MNRRRFRFRLGLREVVAGFDRGIEGMRVGGRRAVADAARAGVRREGIRAVPPNATTRFEVELVAACKEPAARQVVGVVTGAISHSVDTETGGGRGTNHWHKHTQVQHCGDTALRQSGYTQ